MGVAPVEQIEAAIEQLSLTDQLLLMEHLAHAIRQRTAEPPRAARADTGVTALGKYAHIAGSSDDFARDKQHDIVREDRERP